MIEEIAADLYKIEVPLPKNPLRALNSYIVKSSYRNLIIDTGMNREECMNVMKEGLKKLGVELRKTDFFITHFHADHLGLTSSLTTENSVVYFNQLEADRLNRIRFGTYWEDIIHFTRMSGFPEDELQEILQSHPGYQYGLKGELSFKILEDGDSLSVGGYRFRCVKTPGHSKGHICLYEPDKKILVAGDHILNDITPTISLRSDDENPLKEYLSSLDKVYDLDIELVLPGHRGIFRNCRERILELKLHHEKRADEVTTILEEGSQNAYQVASQMSWDVPHDSWDQFPILQKWFATGEAIAHLKYLEEKGMIRKGMRERRIVYSSDLNP
jgi:glyoxylase-like metal-dependent hydrolase (beta-lactamase superfamily II)